MYYQPAGKREVALTSMRFALAMAKNQRLEVKPLHPRQPPFR
jgi:hypothetical protein